MRIVFAVAEVAPYAKVGGLADVAGSLPQALVAAGHEVTIYTPLHTSIDREKFGIRPDGRQRSVGYGSEQIAVRYPEVSRAGVRTIFVQNRELLGRDHPYGFADDDRRYAFFCRSVAADLALGPHPDVVHAHDWHTALLIPMIRDRSATVFTIHNLAYQGKTGVETMDLVGLPRSQLDSERSGELNPMARGIAGAHLVSTVSPSYAEEILTPEFGEGLEGVLRTRRDDLHGIVNGIDTTLFDPETDPHIARHFSYENQSGKASCKAALQLELGLTVNPDVPLCGFIGRLVEQKGIDLLTAVAPELLASGAQLAVLGTGDPAFEERWQALAETHPGRLGLTLGFDAGLAQRIYAGADQFLMPSRFEPCGLGQLLALRYGTIPVVRSVGGLRDTVRDVASDAETGNGFTFQEYSAEAFSKALARAQDAFRNDPAAWQTLRDRALREDHSWDTSAGKYGDLYSAAVAAKRTRPSY